MRRLSAVLAVVAGVSGVGAGPATATELVDNDRAQCPTATHTTIQQGVNAATAGEMVLVCNGVYREQVTIAGPGKDGVQVVANTTHGATVAAPDPATGPLIHVDGADKVQIRRLRITGPFEAHACPASPGENFGVLVSGDVAAVVVRDNEIRSISDRLGEGCFFGTGVAVRDSSRATVLANTIDGYEVGGVEIAGGGSFALVSNNTLTGARVDTTQIGVRLLPGAGADVKNNRILSNRSVDGNGIRLETVAAVSVVANRISDNTIGMQLVQGGALVRNNIVTDNSSVGILITSSAAGNTLDRNDFRGNDGLDCQDESAGFNPTRRGFPFYTTVNRWVNNRGFDADPPQVCTPSGNAAAPVP